MNPINMHLFKHTRYTAFTFPPYAFVPGLNPHPTADPDGHSVTLALRQSCALTPNHWMKNKDYLFGCDLYNHGYWWEAHEAWERVWLSVPRGHQADTFLRALIQAANGLLKLRMQRFKAADRLSKQVGELLIEVNPTGPYYMGVTLAAWFAKYESFISHRGTSMTTPLLVLKQAPIASQ